MSFSVAAGSLIALALLLGRDRLVLAGERGADRVPGQGRALDAARELAHAGEDGELAELGGGAAVPRRRQHVVEPAEELVCLADGLAFEARGHHRGGRLGDGAARALEADIADHARLDVEVDPDLVPAEGVVALRGPVGPVEPPEVARLPVVVEDDLLVQLAQFGHHPKISRTSRSPAPSASSS